MYPKPEELQEVLEFHEQQPDEEGYMFLLNQPKGEPLWGGKAEDYARKLGFMSPIFKVEEAELKKPTKQYESVWVKERFGMEKPDPTDVYKILLRYHSRRKKAKNDTITLSGGFCL